MQRQGFGKSRRLQATRAIQVADVEILVESITHLKRQNYSIRLRSIRSDNVDADQAKGLICRSVTDGAMSRPSLHRRLHLTRIDRPRRCCWSAALTGPHAHCHGPPFVSSRRRLETKPPIDREAQSSTAKEYVAVRMGASLSAPPTRRLALAGCSGASTSWEHASAFLFGAMQARIVILDAKALLYRSPFDLPA